jgi:hypothetical protein
MPYRIAILTSGDADPDEVRTIMDTDPGVQAGVLVDEHSPLIADYWMPGMSTVIDEADSVKRVASAVGEGAMAVTLAHRYLGAP